MDLPDGHPLILLMKNNLENALSSLDLAISLSASIKDPDEFTLNDYIHKTNRSQRMALADLENLVSDGLLVKRKIVIAGHQCNVYRKA